MTAERAARFQCLECGRVQGHGLGICALCGAVMPSTPMLAIVPSSGILERVERERDVAERRIDHPIAFSEVGEVIETPTVRPPSRPTRIDELIARSSLAAPDVVAAREAAPSSIVERVIDRVAELEAKDAPAPVSPLRVSLGSVAREKIDRVPCGVGEVDHVLGGGVPMRRVLMLGGVRGLGKSTLALAISAGVAAASSRRALYCSAEGQYASELAAMLPPEVDGSAIEVCVSSSITRCLAATVDIDPAIVVFDSLQSIDVEGMRRGSDEHASYLLMLLRDLSRSRACCVLALSQMNAAGAMRGSQLFQQFCDTIAMMSLDASGRIIFAIDRKNRGGPTNRRAAFVFDDSGALRGAPLIDVAPAPTSSTEGSE